MNYIWSDWVPILDYSETSISFWSQHKNHKHNKNPKPYGTIWSYSPFLQIIKSWRCSDVDIPQKMFREGLLWYWHFDHTETPHHHALNARGVRRRRLAPQHLLGCPYSKRITNYASGTAGSESFMQGVHVMTGVFLCTRIEHGWGLYNEGAMSG